jgi:hypothetical protein
MIKIVVVLKTAGLVPGSSDFGIVSGRKRLACLGFLFR